MRTVPSPCPWALALLLLLPACAEGGTDDRPSSEVKVSAAHHMFGLRALREFPGLPVKAGDVFPDAAVLNLFDDSTYTVARSGGTSPADDYFIEENGAFSIKVTGSGRDPSVVFQGAYGLTGDRHDFFFTDRARTSNSPSIGIFFGTRETSGKADLQGDWYVFSHHFMIGATVPVPQSVARAAHGTLTAAAGKPGDELALTGTGLESTGVSLDFSGKVQALDDGEANLTLGYANQAGGNADTRVFQAAGGGDVLFAIDQDETDGEAGMLAMVRQHGTPAAPADLEGTWFVGGITAFINPNNAGTDAARGVLDVTAQGAFRLEVVGVNGEDEVFQGTYTLADEGGMTFTVNTSGVSGTETWRAAVDPDYDTLVLVDDFVETRSNNQPQLNFFIAIREK